MKMTMIVTFGLKYDIYNTVLLLKADILFYFENKITFVALIVKPLQEWLLTILLALRK